MSKQPEALLLANILQYQIPSIACLEVAATELRRLHEVNIELLEALKVITDCFLDTEGNHGRYEMEAMDKARAAIAKAEGDEK